MVDLRELASARPGRQVKERSTVSDIPAQVVSGKALVVKIDVHLGGAYREQFGDVERATSVADPRPASSAF